jgi:hypothetical protein
MNQCKLSDCQKERNLAKINLLPIKSRNFKTSRIIPLELVVRDELIFAIGMLDKSLSVLYLKNSDFHCVQSEQIPYVNFFLLSEADHAAARLGHCTLIFVHVGRSECAEEDDMVRILEVPGGNVSETPHQKIG